MMLANGFRLSALRRAFVVFYNIDHEWINFDSKTKTGVVGITEYANEQLGDVTSIKMPEVGSKYKQGEAMGRLESTRVIDDIYCPVSGEIIEVNKKIIEKPDLINTSPMEEGWLVKVRASDATEVEHLYDRKGYDKLLWQLRVTDRD